MSTKNIESIKKQEELREVGREKIVAVFLIIDLFTMLILTK